MRRRGSSSLLAVLLLAGCAVATAEQPPPADGPPPFAHCAEVTQPPSAAGTPPGGDGGGASELPAIELPCFVDGQPVRVDAIRGPAVINLWASYCAPCRVELPAFQRLSQRLGDRLHVIGVDTYDGREAARSIGEDFGLTFPTLYDRDAVLQSTLGRGAVLPMTVFVDGNGRIRHVDTSGALDDEALSTLVARHLDIEGDL